MEKTYVVTYLGKDRTLLYKQTIYALNYIDAIDIFTSIKDTDSFCIVAIHCDSDMKKYDMNIGIFFN